MLKRLFLDDPDDFEQKIPLTKAFLDVFCELIMDTNSSLVQESVVKIILVVIGQQTEDLLGKHADNVIKNINSLVGKLPVNENQETLPLKFEKLLEICVNSCPCLYQKNTVLLLFILIYCFCRYCEANFNRNYSQKSI